MSDGLYDGMRKLLSLPFWAYKARPQLFKKLKFCNTILNVPFIYESISEVNFPKFVPKKRIKLFEDEI